MSKKRVAEKAGSRVSGLLALVIISFRFWQDAQGAKDFWERAANEIPTVLFCVFVTASAWLQFKGEADKAKEAIAERDEKLQEKDAAIKRLQGDLEEARAKADSRKADELRLKRYQQAREAYTKLINYEFPIAKYHDNAKALQPIVVAWAKECRALVCATLGEEEGRDFYEQRQRGSHIQDSHLNHFPTFYADAYKEELEKLKKSLTPQMIRADWNPEAKPSEEVG